MIQYTQEAGDTIDPKELAVLFRRAGLPRPVGDLERIEKMTKHANLIICARDKNRLVGIARALTDFCYCCYLSDLAVDSAYQKQGVGKKLIQKVTELIGEGSSLLLLSAPQATSYYSHLGFQKVENAWKVPRKR